MIDENGEPMIIDFGNAKNYVRSCNDGLSVILKPGFAPPEQYTGKDQGPWTDVYSLAGVFYYMVAGIKVPPSTERLTGESYTELYKLVPECPHSISQAVDKALALKPSERTQTVREMLKVFEEHLFNLKDSKRCFDEKQKLDKKNNSVKMPYIVIYEYGHKVGKWRLPSDSQVIIGRDARYSNIIVGEYDNIISKQHCIVSFDSGAGEFYVMDISTNGTFIRGRKIEKNKEYRLKEGEQIAFGKSKYIIEMGVEE